MRKSPLFAQAKRRMDLATVTGLLCVAALLGGSSLEGLDGHLVLQALSILVIGWVVLQDRSVPWRPSAVFALALLGALAVLALFQLIGWPGADWAEGSPRQLVTAAWTQLDLQEASLGLSLAPSETVSAILALLPPLAVFAVVATSRWTQTVQPICWVIAGVGCASAALGLLQMLSGTGSPLYLHGAETGLPLGFFSNPNHQASLLLMTLPIMLGLLLDRRRDVQTADGQMGLLILAVGGVLMLTAGVVAAGSIAGFGLLAGIIPLCLVMTLPTRKGGGAVISLSVLGAGLVVGLAVLLVGSTLPDSVWASDDGALGRPAIWNQSLEIAWEHFPFGIGFGAFEYVYPLYETDGAISGRYMNAAHNDYLQVFVELGAGGALLMVCGVGLWAFLSVQAWRSERNTEGLMRRAMSIATMVVLMHSLVDYPLHAPLYAVMAAACLGVLALPPRQLRTKRKASAEPSAKRLDL
ncbi:MAG: O-antigen ligase family protein [Pseudomonadota bacterium]